MRDYQLTGLDWMVDQIDRHGLSPILGDEMGLGKTLQTISVIAHLKHDLKLSHSIRCSAWIPSVPVVYINYARCWERSWQPVHAGLLHH